MTDWLKKPGVYYVLKWWQLLIYILIAIGAGIAFGNMIWG